MPPYPKRPQMLDEAQKQCKCDRSFRLTQIWPTWSQSRVSVRAHFLRDVFVLSRIYMEFFYQGRTKLS